MFDKYLAHFFIEWEMFQTKVVQKNKHIFNHFIIQLMHSLV